MAAPIDRSESTLTEFALDLETIVDNEAFGQVFRTGLAVPAAVSAKSFADRIFAPVSFTANGYRGTGSRIHRFDN